MSSKHMGSDCISSWSLLIFLLMKMVHYNSSKLMSSKHMGSDCISSWSLLIFLLMKVASICTIDKIINTKSTQITYHLNSCL